MASKKQNELTVAAFFSGAGGLDLGFRRGGFTVPWANEFDKSIWPTYLENHPGTELVTKSIVDVTFDEIPKVTGYIGGPPCQSWSEAGAGRGEEDLRGQLFFNYLNLVERNKPAFFQAENVSGILAARHEQAFRRILQGFLDIGYNVSYGLVRASKYGVPQDRDRVFIVGYRTDLEKVFVPPKELPGTPTLRDAIWDLRDGAKPAAAGTSNGDSLKIPNHEYMTGGFSSMFMSRNRVRSWDEPSFTIQAGARHAPIHPQAPKMIKIDTDRFEFAPESQDDYRRFSVREIARIQTFPDDFVFKYSRISDGYKMIGNAVPVALAEAFARRIFDDLSSLKIQDAQELTPGKLFTFNELVH